MRDDQDFLNSLNSQAATLAANDDPVAAFLQSSAFTSVAPEGAAVRPHPPVNISTKCVVLPNGIVQCLPRKRNTVQ